MLYTRGLPSEFSPASGADSRQGWQVTEIASSESLLVVTMDPSIPRPFSPKFGWRHQVITAVGLASEGLQGIWQRTTG